VTLNPGQGSLKVIESDTIRYLAYGFLLPPHSNFVSKMHRFHRFRDTTTYWLKIVEKTQTPLICHLFWGDPLRIFRQVILSQKLESWGYQRCTFHDPAFALLGTIPACDGRTDRRTDGRPDTSLSQRPALAERRAGKNEIRKQVQIKTVIRIITQCIIKKHRYYKGLT